MGDNSQAPMTGDGVDEISAERPIFQALLVPYRSLGKRGFRILMALVAGASATIGLASVAHGAWPVFGFFGLDVLLVYGAFRLSYASARAREEVRVSRTELSIRKVSPRGRVDESRFNPFWARFAVRRHAEYGILSMNVAGEGRVTEIGRFLNPDDRESFAKAFNRALLTAKGR